MPAALFPCCSATACGFLAATCFPLEPRHDTNWRAFNLGDDMDQIDRMLAKWQPTALSLFRFITGLLLFQFGVAKILKFPVIPDGNAYAFLNKVQLMSLSGAAGAIELILGALLLLGLFTRPVAFILAGEMAFAYFIGHAPRSFFPVLNGGDAAILFCFVFLYLAAAGAGPW